MDMKMCATSDVAKEWDKIDWNKANAYVKKLQMRIVKAHQEGKHGRVKSLQWLLTHSFYARALAVKRVTENRGKMDLDIQVSKLKLMKANHTSQKYRLEDNIAKHYPQQIAVLKERIEGMQADIVTAKANLPTDKKSVLDKEQFTMKVGNKVYTDKKEAGTALVEMCKEMKSVNTPTVIGEYAGFKMAVSFDSFNHKFVMNVKGQLSHNLEIGSDPIGNITRINNALESMHRQLEEAQTKLATVEHQLETAKVEVTKPFAQEAELAEKLDRLSALNALLNMDEKGDDAIGMDDDTPDVKIADKPAARVSLKAKLEVMKEKVAGENVGKFAPQKVQGKEALI